MRAVVTGASGLLGRAVYSQFKSKGHDVRGLAFTRAADDLIRLDLQDGEMLDDFLGIFRPAVVVHCAAERRPDVAEADPEGAKKLNVKVPENLATLSKTYKFKLIYICTDYVFDGNAPPEGYDVDATPKPTNLYGETKLSGEQVVLETGEPGKVTSLRVPVLYGKAEKNSESAVNVIIDAVYKAAAGTKVKQDDWATRYPTLVDDVARILEAVAVLTEPLPPRLHFSAQRMYTKYNMATIFANLLGLGPKALPNFERVTTGPGPGETVRPRDCHLSNAALELLGINVSTTDFEDWWRQDLVK